MYSVNYGSVLNFLRVVNSIGATSKNVLALRKNAEAFRVKQQMFANFLLTIQRENCVDGRADTSSSTCGNTLIIIIIGIFRRWVYGGSLYCSFSFSVVSNLSKKKKTGRNKSSLTVQTAWPGTNSGQNLDNLNKSPVTYKGAQCLSGSHRNAGVSLAPPYNV